MAQQRHLCEVCGGPNPEAYATGPGGYLVRYAHEECYERVAQEAEARLEESRGAWNTASTRTDAVMVFFAVVV
jgi:hypothetical protein